MSSFFMTTMVLSYIAIKFHDWHNAILVHLSCFFPACALIQGFIRMNYHELLGENTGPPGSTVRPDSIRHANHAFLVLI